MSNDDSIKIIISFAVGMIIMALTIIGISLADDAALNDVSIQCGKLGYDKAFQNNNIYYCAHELERIDE